ncbi:MAG: protein TolQ [Neomegalonema sp.]|nr:protein TolQ [Neomegalonema sp.]
MDLIAAFAVEAGQALDFSVQALFMRAHWVVKVVMILLVLASIWSWAIMFEKSVLLGRLRRGASKFEDAFWSGKPLDQLYEEIGANASNPLERVFVAGMREWRRTFDAKGTELFGGARDRIDRAMTVVGARESERLEARLGHLATIGAVTPFVGLFGTVWGIKNSFEEIALSQNTSIAVVAPGIAEALVATALGLFAAIPAVIAYNQLINSSNRLNVRLENFSDEFATILSRQLDKQGAA